MHIVKTFLMALSIALLSVGCAVRIAPGPGVGGGGVVYQHGGPHHRTTVVVPFGTAPQMGQGAYPPGTRLHVLCQVPGYPIDYGGRPACRLPNGQVVAPLQVQVENVGGGYGYNNGYGGGYQSHAGTAPMVNGMCPHGMVPAPRTPQQLPGCW